MCVNRPDQKWARMLPELGKDSPLFTLLRVDPRMDAATLMIDFPAAIHIPKHTHEKRETHIILRGIAPVREQRHRRAFRHPRERLLLPVGPNRSRGVGSGRFAGHHFP